MDAITPEVEVDEKRDARGRKIIGERRREEVLAGYEASGLTQKAYARREGVNYRTFVAWLGQRTPGERDSAPGGSTLRRNPAEPD